MGRERPRDLERIQPILIPVLTVLLRVLPSTVHRVKAIKISLKHRPARLTACCRSGRPPQTATSSSTDKRRRIRGCSPGDAARAFYKYLASPVGQPCVAGTITGHRAMLHNRIAAEVIASVSPFLTASGFFEAGVRRLRVILED